jgi:hypothetical protein
MIPETEPRYLLTPLPRQSPHDLIVTLFVVTACGLRLRPELRVRGLTDAEAVRAALRRVEWREGR